MKILHTADWHLGKKLEQFSRLSEQKKVMHEICLIADQQNVDVVIVAGDLFDTFNPPNEAVDLFYKTLKKLSNNGKRLVVAIAGNHDSPERIEAPNPLAIENGIILTGFPNSKVSKFKLDSGIEVTEVSEGFVEVKLPNVEFPLRMLLTPYANEYRLKTYLGNQDKEESLRDVLEKHWKENATKHCDNKGVNILMTHLFMIKKGETPPEEPDDEKPILHVGGAQVVYTHNIPTQIQYTALGHLHRPHQMDSEPCPVVYSGSPISYSFSEANQQKYVSIVELFPNQQATRQQIELTGGRKLLRKKFSNIAKAIVWLTENEEALVELTIQTNTFLTAQDRKNIYASHNGIVTLIPELVGGEAEKEELGKQIDLSQNMNELFRQYFKSKNGVDPNQEIIDLFNEVKNE